MKLPQTNESATISFYDANQANDFAKMYTRKTLMGNSISRADTMPITVTIWNVTDDIKEWIASYIETLTNEVK